MARIRTIKPAFFSSLSNADLPIPTRVTWIGLWTYVDDKGRGVDDARLVKAAVWPLDDGYTTKKVEADLARLEAAGKIGRYEVAGQRYFAVVKWRDHQRIDKPQRSLIPPAPWEEASGNIPGTFPEDDGNGTGTMPPKAGGEVEGKGREGNRKGKEPDKSSSSHHGVAPESAEEEEEIQETANDAAMVVARRRLSARDGPPITNPTAWLAKTAQTVYDEHAGEFRRWWHEGLTAEDMADRIQPLPPKPYPEAGEYRPAFSEDDVTIDEHGRWVVKAS